MKRWLSIALALSFITGANCAYAANIDSLSPESLAKEIPQPDKSLKIKILPARLFSLLPTSIYLDMQKAHHQDKQGNEINIILLSRGNANLETLAKTLSDDRFLEKMEDGSWLLKAPLFVSQNASMQLVDETLKLSIEGTSLIFYQGKLFVFDSTVTSWDVTNNTSGQREQLDKSKLTQLGVQKMRPYLHGMDGSRTIISASKIHGLGYAATPSGYGISFARRNNEESKRTNIIEGVLNTSPPPSGLIIGSEISNCFFGFYSAHGKDIKIIGNIFKNNIIYNIDPHDYTEELLISRNLVHDAKYKHGIIISRGVENAVISENISVGNNGAGIMIDRNSHNTIIKNNLVTHNNGDGISVLESNNVNTYNNVVFNNIDNGFFARNSQHMKIENNEFSHNGGDGIGIEVTDIGNHKHRDFTRDPYTQKASASVTGNKIEKNLRWAVSAKKGAQVDVRDNDLSGSAPSLFGGELNSNATELIKLNKTGKVQ